MHADQLEIPTETVRRLLVGQFPQWSSMQVRPVASDGTVNALFRLGERLVLRMPLQVRPADEVLAELNAEQHQARRLAAGVTLAVPVPVALGQPGPGYPMPWAVYEWLPGEPAGEHDGDSESLARTLAGFVGEVRQFDTAGRKFSGSWRGGRLADHDAGVHDALAKSSRLVDTDALQSIWVRLRDTPRLDEPDLWTHGDLMPGNLLVRHHRLVAVLDVGGLAVRDPAVDLAPAWNLFGASPRAVFRAALNVRSDTWDRGKGWSLVQAINALHYYEHSNPSMAETARRTLHAIQSDEARRNG